MAGKRKEPPAYEDPGRARRCTRHYADIVLIDSLRDSKDGCVRVRLKDGH